MSRHDRIEHRLRATDPAADLQADPDDATARHLRSRALRSGRAARRNAPRARLVAAGAAALLAASSVGAVAAGVFDPDPGEIDSILAEAEEIGRYEVKTDDWRPTLRSERVICAHEDGTLGSTSVAHPAVFPIDEGIDEADLIAACVEEDHGADGMRHLEWSHDFTVCEGAVPAGEVRATYQQMAAEQPDGAKLVERIGGDRPAFPVVLGWDAECDQTRIPTSPGSTELDAWTATSTLNLNRTREIEIGLTAAAIDGCLDTQDAASLAMEARAELPGDWAILSVLGPDASRDEGPLCSQVRIDSQGRGILTIEPMDPGPS